MVQLPLAPCEKMLKRSNLRVSKDAVIEFAVLLEEIISDIGAEAETIARGEKRRTIKVEDIRIIRKRMLE